MPLTWPDPSALTTALLLILTAIVAFALPYHRMPRRWRGPWRGVFRWPWS